MAGGEGTRLRPLTSNVPEADDAAGEPADDGTHRRTAEGPRLRTTSSSPWHSWRTIDPATTSEMAPSSVSEWSTRPRRLRSAPPARFATQWMSSTEPFLVISGDVLTDIDPVEDRRGPPRRRKLARDDRTRGGWRIALEFGIVITREDGSIERFLEKPGWGQVFSRHDQHGHLHARTGDLRLHRGRSARSTSRREVFPALLRRRASRIYGAIAEGYWADVGTLESPTSSAHTDILDRHRRARDRRVRRQGDEHLCSARTWTIDPDATPRRPRGDR